MEIFKEIASLKAFLSQKRGSVPIGLVPTMGALHAGHMSLIEASKKENGLTVCSIFVNPAQFNNAKDLEKYPRTLEQDVEMLKRAGCDVVFAPEAKEMYETEPTIKFDFGDLDKVLEGKFRPGHFSGVALVVAKFFNLVQPTVAYFGQKDFQQFKIIERLVKELKFDLQLKPMPILRESDGLAMSSRNMRLNDIERKKATVLFQSLAEAHKLLRAGIPLYKVKETVRQKCESIEGVRLEYFELAGVENLKALEGVTDKAILLIAAYVGEVRLIDNLLLNEN
ncbi:MAG TPA: pantoate--beta-alanine ligase [Cyclobacteriaceae bacterium]|jgi:pantoate--beta-alanine ligase|nr:pantoate--beta-alanine ligase [Cyclobacteriaceae bacterium]